MIELLLVSLFQAVSGAPAEAPPAPAQAEQTGAAPAPVQPQDVMRCRMVPMEGSNLRQRRCTTAAQDELANQESARAVRDVQSNSGRFGQVVTSGGQ